MMKIYNWDEFLIDESVIYLSPPFKKMLKGIDHPIAKELLELEGQNPKDDISLIHFDTELESPLVFNTSKNVCNLLRKNWEEPGQYDPDFFDSEVSRYITDDYLPGLGEDLWLLANWDGRTNLRNRMFGGKGTFNNQHNPWLKSANPIKIGKLVNKLLPGKFTPGDIESFTNILKSIEDANKVTFKIVEGKEIEYYYKRDNYDLNSGTIGNSCMTDKPSEFFNLYTKNPDKVRLLTLVKGSSVIGRAFVWKLNSCNDYMGKAIPAEYFLDRVYSPKDSTVINFIDYAEKEGWAWRTHNTYSDPDKITFNKKNYSGISMSVKLGDFDYSKYPYLDTMKLYDKGAKTLYNSERIENFGEILLTRTDGSYRDSN